MTFQYPPVSPYGYITTIKTMAGTAHPQFYLKNAKQMGDIFKLNFLISGRKPVAIVNPTLQRQILNDKTSLKPSTYKIMSIDDRYPDLFTSEGLAWKHSRKGVAPAFASQHITRMTSIAVQMTEEWMETRLERFAASGESFDVCKEMLHLTLSIISKAAFNYEFTPDEKELFLSDIKFSLKERLKFRIPFRKRLGMFIPAVQECKKAGQRLHALCLKIVQAYRESGTTLPGSCIDLIVNNPNYINDEHRACDVFILLVAGHDTTAYTVSWTLLELAKNPSIQDELRLALQKALSISITSGIDVNYANVKEFQNVIAESIRLNPVVAGGSIRALGSDLLVEGKTEEDPNIIVPKGSLTWLSPFARNRNPRYYDDPDKFLPDRWNDVTMKNAMSELMPFAVGRRDCVGQSLANAEINTVLPKLCEKYSFSVVDEGRIENFVTYKPIGARLVAKKVA